MKRWTAFAPGLAAAAACAGCIATAPIPVVPGRNANPADCVVPVRATIRDVRDDRGTTSPSVAGWVRSRYAKQAVVLTEPPSEALEKVLSETLERCAPPPSRPGAPLVLDVSLSSLQLDQTGYDYRIVTEAGIDFSVRVFQADGGKFVGSFDVHEGYKGEAEMGSVPEIQFIADRLLHDAADRFTWEFVPIIRSHGS